MERKFDISTFVDILTKEKALCNLVNRYVSLRKELKITQRELSTRSGVSYGSIRRFESTGDISLNSLLNIAVALGCLEDFEKLFVNTPIIDVEKIFYGKW